MMLVLGIDPSTVATGYGLVELKNSMLRTVDYGVIRPPAAQHLHQRIKIIYDRVTEITSQVRPDAVAIEDLFYSRNIKVALSLGQARGAVILAAVNQGLPIFEYAPRTVKQAVTGSGSASKEQVQRMTQRLLNLAEPPQPLDASDALAIAICHLLKSRQKITL